jgi:hypothetical protein
MAFTGCNLEAASVDPGRPDLGTDPREIYRNLGIEIFSLQHSAKCDKIRDFLRRNANGRVNVKCLADQIGFPARTLQYWMSEIKKEQKEMRQSAQVQAMVPAVAAQGMVPNVFVHNAAHPSLMLGHARQPQTGSISSYAVRAHPAPTVHRWRHFCQNNFKSESMRDGINCNVMAAAARQAAASPAASSLQYAGPYYPVL